MLVGPRTAPGQRLSLALDSPIRSPTPTPPPGRPARIEPMTDLTEIAAWRSKATYMPPTPTRRPTPERPTRPPHPTYAARPTRSPWPTQPPQPTPSVLPTRTPQLAGEAASRQRMEASPLVEPLPLYAYAAIGAQSFWRKIYAWKGVGAANFRDQGTPVPHDLAGLDLSWWRDWASLTFVDVQDSDFQREVGYKYCASANPTDRRNHAREMADLAQRYPGRVWLLYNEPDTPPLCDANENCKFPTLGPACPLCINRFVHSDMIETQNGKYASGFNGHPFDAEDGAEHNAARLALCQEPWPRNDPSQQPLYWTDTVIRTISHIPQCGQPGYEWCDPANYTMAVRVFWDAQAKVLADDYASMYSAIKAADPTARVFCCGNYHTYPTEFWLAFLYHLETKHPDVHLDGVHLHTYPYSASTYYDEITGCEHGAQAGTSIKRIWDNCLSGVLAAYNSFHQGAAETSGKPIWLSEYGVLSSDKAQDEEHVATGLMIPMAAWIGLDSHRYTGVAWFIAHQAPDDPNITEHTGLLQDTPTPYSVPKPTVGARYATYPPDAYPATATPTPAP